MTMAPAMTTWGTTLASGVMMAAMMKMIRSAYLKLRIQFGPISYG